MRSGKAGAASGGNSAPQPVGADDFAQPLATKERYGCGPPLAGAHQPFCPVSPDYRFCGNTATVPPAARPHKLHIPRPAASGRSRPFRCSSSPNCKRFAGLQFGSICLARKSRQKEVLRPRKLQATLRSAYVRLSQSRGAKLALLEPHAIPRPAAGGRPRPFRCSSSPNCKRFAGLQFGSIWLVRKSMQKETLDTNRIVPQATEESRRKTLRPTHGNFSAKLNYSAACVETTLPSRIVATQGDGKTRCRGMQNASTYAPMVQNICVLLYNMLCKIVTSRVFRK